MRMGLLIRSISKDTIIRRGLVTKSEGFTFITKLLLARSFEANPAKMAGLGSSAFLAQASLTFARPLEATSETGLQNGKGLHSDEDHSYIKQSDKSVNVETKSPDLAGRYRQTDSAIRRFGEASLAWSDDSVCRYAEKG